jgi:hypothetical protein
MRWMVGEVYEWENASSKLTRKLRSILSSYKTLYTKNRIIGVWCDSGQRKKIGPVEKCRHYEALINDHELVAHVVRGIIVGAGGGSTLLTFSRRR